MKAKDLRNKSVEELKELLGKERREQFKQRLLKSGGDMVRTDQIKTIRRNIARILTISTELEGKA